MSILQAGFQVVARTAQHGLIESSESDTEKARWFYIWTGDIAGELGEVMKLRSQGQDSEEILTEVGDAMWGICAVAMLNDIEPEDLLSSLPSYSVCGSFSQCLIKSLELLDYGKKVCRDGIAVRPIDREFVIEKLVLIYGWLHFSYELEIAIALVDAKLWKRYPNGFTPEASVNRVV